MSNLPLQIAAARGVLVGRPRRGVAHIYVGPLTRSGRFAPRNRRPTCGQRTRQLSVLERVWSTLDGDRRVCASCSARFTGKRAEQPRLVSRADDLAAYGQLNFDDLMFAAALTRTEEDTYAVGRIAMMLFGPAGTKPSPAYAELDSLILRRRNQLRRTERTPEEIEDLRRQRETAQHNDALLAAGRRKELRIEKARKRRAKGQYLMPAERDLVANDF